MPTAACMLVANMYMQARFHLVGIIIVFLLTAAGLAFFPSYLFCFVFLLAKST